MVGRRREGIALSNRQRAKAGLDLNEILRPVALYLFPPVSICSSFPAIHPWNCKKYIYYSNEVSSPQIPDPDREIATSFLQAYCWNIDFGGGNWVSNSLSWKSENQDSGSKVDIIWVNHWMSPTTVFFIYKIKVWS